MREQEKVKILVITFLLLEVKQDNVNEKHIGKHTHSAGWRYHVNLDLCHAQCVENIYVELNKLIML